MIVMKTSRTLLIITIAIAAGLIRANDEQTQPFNESSAVSLILLQNHPNTVKMALPTRRPTITMQKIDGAVSDQPQDGEVTFGSRITVQQFSSEENDGNQYGSVFLSKTLTVNNATKHREEVDIPKIHDPLKLVSEMIPPNTETDLKLTETTEQMNFISGKDKITDTTVLPEKKLTIITETKPLLEDKPSVVVSTDQQKGSSLAQNASGDGTNTETILIVQKLHRNPVNSSERVPAVLKSTATGNHTEQFTEANKPENSVDFLYKNSLFPQYTSSTEEDKSETKATVFEHNASPENWNSAEALQTTTEVSNDVTSNIRTSNQGITVFSNDCQFPAKTSVSAYKVYGEANPDKTDERLLDIQTKTESFESRITPFKSEEVLKESKDTPAGVNTVILTGSSAGHKETDNPENFVAESKEEPGEITTTTPTTSTVPSDSTVTVAKAGSEKADATGAIDGSDEKQVDVKLKVDANNIKETTDASPLIVPLETSNWTLNSVTVEGNGSKVELVREVKKEGSAIDVNGTVQVSRTVTDEIITTYSYLNNITGSKLLINKTETLNNSSSVVKPSDKVITANSTAGDQVNRESARIAENSSSSGVTEDLRLNSAANNGYDVDHEQIMENEGSGDDIVNTVTKTELQAVNVTAEPILEPQTHNPVDKENLHRSYLNGENSVRKQKLRHVNNTAMLETLSNKTAPTIEGVVNFVTSANAAEGPEQRVNDENNGFMCIKRSGPEAIRASSEGVFATMPLVTVRGNTRRKWQPFQMDCSTEEDEKGEMCTEWARSGLCFTHRPTMFLFCRRTCLCIGPPDY